MANDVLSNAELAEMVLADPMRVVIPADPSDPEDFDVTAEALLRSRHLREFKQIRRQLGFTQQEIASRLGVAKNTVRDWEQGLSRFPKYAITLARLFRDAPETVEHAMAA